MTGTCVKSSWVVKDSSGAVGENTLWVYSCCSYTQWLQGISKHTQTHTSLWDIPTFWIPTMHSNIDMRFFLPFPSLFGDTKPRHILKACHYLTLFIIHSGIQRHFPANTFTKHCSYFIEEFWAYFTVLQRKRERCRQTDRKPRCKQIARQAFRILTRRLSSHPGIEGVMQGRAKRREGRESVPLKSCSPSQFPLWTSLFDWDCHTDKNKRTVHISHS